MIINKEKTKIVHNLLMLRKVSGNCNCLQLFSYLKPYKCSNKILWLNIAQERLTSRKTNKQRIQSSYLSVYPSWVLSSANLSLYIHSFLSSLTFFLTPSLPLSVPIKSTNSLQSYLSCFVLSISSCLYTHTHTHTYTHTHTHTHIYIYIYIYIYNFFTLFELCST